MDQAEMERIARGWGLVAEQYLDQLGDELSYKPFDRAWLARFARSLTPGIVGDVGCGPGHLTRHLAGLGLDVVGVDLTEGMILQARATAPELCFVQGNMLDLPVADAEWTGAVAFYSLINLARESLPAALNELHRVLAPGGLFTLAVHEGDGVKQADELFGQPVPMVVTMFGRDEVVSALEGAGFEVLEVHTREPYAEEFQSCRIYALARRAA